MTLEEVIEKYPNAIVKFEVEDEVGQSATIEVPLSSVTKIEPLTIDGADTTQWKITFHDED